MSIPPAQANLGRDQTRPAHSKSINDCGSPAAPLSEALYQNWNAISHSQPQSTQMTAHGASQTLNQKLSLDEVIHSLDRALSSIHGSIEKELNSYDDHYLVHSFLNYLQSHRDVLEHDHKFITKVQEYINTGTSSSQSNGTLKCPHIRANSELSDHDAFDNLLEFAKCFNHVSDSEILMGDWGKSEIQRGQFNSFLDLITTPYTPYTYIHPDSSFPNLHEFKSQFLLAAFPSINHLIRLSGALTLLKSKVESKNFTLDHLQDLSILMSTLIQDLRKTRKQMDVLQAQSQGQVQNPIQAQTQTHTQIQAQKIPINSFSLNDSEAPHLVELSAHMAALIRTLEHSLNKICSDSKAKLELAGCQG